MKAEETYDILTDILEDIDLSFIGTSVEEVSTGVYKIYTEDTKWLTKGFTITIDGIDYVIEDFEFNEWIKISGESIPEILEFDIYEPIFEHGTVLEQNELLNIKREKQIDSTYRLPLIWLRERVNERFETDELLRLDRESDCQIFFLIDCNIEDWLRPDFDKYTIKPMRNLVAEVVRLLNESPRVQVGFVYNVSDDARFGVYQDDKGTVKQTFSEALSGCGLRSTIPFLKSNC